MADFPTEAPAPAPPVPEPAPLPFRRPADHYASDAPLRPLVPRGVSLGCGWTALAIVVLIFVLGAFAPRMTSIIDFVFGSMQNEIAHSFTKDVTPAQRTAFNIEFGTLRARLRGGQARLDRVQPLLKAISDVSGDEKVTPPEADRLIAAIRDANRRQ